METSNSNLNTKIKLSKLQEARALYENKEYEKSFSLYKELAEAGDADAQFNLGILYANGYGVLKNYIKAFVWYEKAALQGYDEAYFNLGLFYYNALGIP